MFGLAGCTKWPLSREEGERFAEHQSPVAAVVEVPGVPKTRVARSGVTGPRSPAHAPPPRHRNAEPPTRPRPTTSAAGCPLRGRAPQDLGCTWRTRHSRGEHGGAETRRCPGPPSQGSPSQPAQLGATSVVSLRVQGGVTRASLWLPPQSFPPSASEWGAHVIVAEDGALLAPTVACCLLFVFIRGRRGNIFGFAGRRGPVTTQPSCSHVKGATDHTQAPVFGFHAHEQGAGLRGVRPGTLTHTDSESAGPQGRKDRRGPRGRALGPPAFLRSWTLGPEPLTRFPSI